MVFLILWFGFYLRKGLVNLLIKECLYCSKNATKIEWQVTSILLRFFYSSSLTSLSKSEGWPYFWFLLFRTLFPFGAGLLGSFLIMLIYSELGGLKAIIYADSLQGTLLLIVVWIVAFNCLNQVGGWNALF